MTPARRLAIGLVSLNAVALVLVAAVSAPDGVRSEAAAALPADALPVSEVARRAETRGMTRIARIAVEGTAYRVDGLDGAGRRVAMRVDAVSGTVRD